MYKWWTFLFCFCFSISWSQDELLLLSNWRDTTIIDTLGFNNPYNEVWGFALQGKEYGVIGSVKGTHIIDVTNPREVKEVAFVSGRDSLGVVIHRDYHDYEGYLYAVADEGAESTLQIIDLRNLPSKVDLVYDSKELIRRAHNIFIDSSKARLYAFLTAGDSLNRKAMRIFDISDHENPQVLASYNEFEGNRINHVHDGFVRNDTAYLNCGPDGFYIVDFSDVNNPNTLTFWLPGEYPQSGYNHSGWLSPDGKYYYMADETPEMDIKVINVSNLPDLSVTDTIDAESTLEGTIVHNPIVACNYLYVSYYNDGLQVFDLTDPEHPKRSHFFRTQDSIRAGFNGAWGVYPFLPSGNILVSDMDSGFFVLKSIDPFCNDPNFELSLDPLDFKLYPNPNNGQFNIKLESVSDPSGVQLHVLDIQGRTVAQPIHLEDRFLYHEITMDLPSGLYFVELRGDQILGREKLIITR